MDLGAIADAWVEQHQSVQALRPTLQPAQAPAPQQPEAPPSMRQTPDGGWIGRDFSLSWEGYQGDPGSRVTLARADGYVVYQGRYGDLSAVQIPGVWIPSPQAQVQQQQAMQPVQQQPAMTGGLAGIGEAPQTTGRSGFVRFLGTVAAAAAAGGTAWAVTRWVRRSM